MVPATARAHDPGLSLLDVRIEPHRIGAALSLAVADAKLIESGSGSLERFALESIALLVDGRRLTGVVESRQTDGEDGLRITLSFDRGAGSRLSVVSAAPANLARGHRQLLTVRTDGGEVLTQRMLDAASGAVEVDLGPAASGRRDRAKAGLFGVVMALLGVLYCRVAGPKGPPHAWLHRRNARRACRAARWPLAIAPSTVPVPPSVSAASPAKNSVRRIGRASAAGASAPPTIW